MSRTRRFINSLLTGYGTISVNIATSLLSIPIALSYLTKEEFGLWALALQINGYLSLIDMGMTGAIGRYLTDHKDEVRGKDYCEHFSTGCCVFILQSAIVILLGILLSGLVPEMLSIRSGLHDEFERLLQMLCIILGFSIGLRMFGSPLWAFQRMDIVNITSLFGLITQFLGMWVGFELGFGVFSFAYAFIIPTLLTPIFYIITCKRNNYYPSGLNWFQPKWQVFLNMFKYGKDGMLLSIGSQLVNATQVTIVSRVLGLNAAASFSIATKLFSLSTMFFHKIVESAAPSLAEMHVRGEHEQLAKRYRDIIELTMAAAAFGAVGIAAGNSSFISFWTSNKISWSIGGDLLLGLMVLFTSITLCFITLFGVTKNLRPVRGIYFIEGVIFVPSAVIGAKFFGLEGVLIASLASQIIISFGYSYKAACRVVGSCIWIAKPIATAVILIFISSLVAWISGNQGVHVRSVIAVSLVFSAGYIVWKMIIPHEMSALVSTKATQMSRIILTVFSKQ